jgi:hypothetical protein
MNNFSVESIDTAFYNKQICDFIPDEIIDAHSHIWLKEFKVPGQKKQRATAWSALIAEDNSIEDLMETYKMIFPGKKQTPVIFGKPSTDYNLALGNQYVEEIGKRYNIPTLFISTPEMSAMQFEKEIISGGFKGNKVYLNFSPSYIPGPEIRIFDFLPHHQLEVLNQYGWVSMLHIPRPGRLKDPVNIAQLLEIERKYKNIKLIVAHVGRAYTDNDIGNAFEMLSETENMLFDISANTSSTVFSKLIKTVGSKRILFGIDMPVFRMRGARVVEDGVYYNIIPKGLYGDVSQEVHMREVEDEEAKNLTLMVYEEIAAFRVAAENTSLNKTDIVNVFYNNAARIFLR